MHFSSAVQVRLSQSPRNPQSCLAHCVFGQKHTSSEYMSYAVPPQEQNKILKKKPFLLSFYPEMGYPL